MRAELASDGRDTTEKQLDAGTWGVFLLWIGAWLLAQLSWGVGLFGVGAIILGAQLVRRMLGLRFDGFWLVVGGLFVLAGAWRLAPFGISISLVPALCILAGLGLLGWALSRRATPPYLA